MDEMEHDILSDPAFVRLVAEREAELARVKRDHKVAHLGTVLQMYREDAGLTRAELSERSGVKLETIYLLERQLLTFDEITLEMLQALVKPLRLNVLILAAAGEFSVGEFKRDTQPATWRRSDS